jgi:hypothetical protein
VKRREFITLLGGALVTWPSYAGAERASKVARIGFLVTGTLTSAEQQTTLNASAALLRAFSLQPGSVAVSKHQSTWSSRSARASSNSRLLCRMHSSAIAVLQPISASESI